MTFSALSCNNQKVVPSTKSGGNDKGKANGKGKNAKGKAKGNAKRRATSKGGIEDPIMMKPGAKPGADARKSGEPKRRKKDKGKGKGKKDGGVWGASCDLCFLSVASAKRFVPLHATIALLQPWHTTNIDLGQLWAHCHQAWPM